MEEMTIQEETKLEQFFEKGQFIVAPGKYKEEEYGCYLWESIEEASQFIVENPDVHIYTLVETDGDDMYIALGMKQVNRFATLLSVHDAGLKLGEEVRFI